MVIPQIMSMPVSCKLFGVASGIPGLNSNRDVISSQEIHPLFVQANAYQWIAALLRDEDIDGQFINSRCSAILVSSSTY